MKRLLAILLLPLCAFAQGRIGVTLETVASLESRRAINGEVVNVLGFSSAGDWGSPKQFRWDATNALGTNAIRRGTNAIGRWVHEWDGDVLAFGAKPDWNTSTQSGTDNADAFEAAFTYAAGITNYNRNHRRIFVPAGDYYFSRGIAFPSLSQADGGPDSQYILLEGEWDHSTVLVFGGTTNNCITINGSMTSLKNLLITSTTARDSYTSTDDTLGNGVLIHDPTDGFTARFRLENVRISQQPRHGLMVYGGIELLYAVNLWTRANAYDGIHLEKDDTFVADPNRNLFVNCRSDSNGRYGFYVEGVFNRFVTPEGLNNAGGVQMYFGQPNRGNSVENPDMEFISDLTATASVSHTGGLVIQSISGDDTITATGYDFASNGWQTNQFISLYGTTSNDGVFKVTTVSNDTLYVDASLSFLATTETVGAGTNVVITQSPSGIGIAMIGGRHNRIEGGFFGSLLGGILLYGSSANSITMPETANYSADYGMRYGVHIGNTASYGNIIDLSSYDSGGISNTWISVSGTTNVIRRGFSVDQHGMFPTLSVRQPGGSTSVKFERLDTSDQMSLSFSGSRPTWITQSGDPVVIFTDQTTSSANKTMSLGTYPYGSFAGTWVEGVTLNAQSSANWVNIGGGSGSAYDATLVRIWSATNTTTTTGQEVGRFSSTATTGKTGLWLTDGSGSLQQVGVTNIGGVNTLYLIP